MPKFSGLISSLCLFLLASSLPVHAEKVLSGYACSLQVHKLTSDIDWYKNLGKAEDVAKEQNKLILWVHMVGKIDGAT